VMDQYQIDRAVAAGIELMAVMTEVHGVDRGYEIWEQFNTVLGSEVKDAIFLSMLSGQSSGSVKIMGLRREETGSVNKIEVIKCVRTFTGFGLKEAKDLIDQVFDGADITVPVMYTQRRKFVEALKDIRVRVV
jgi:ribosomal protein L7/L12